VLVTGLQRLSKKVVKAASTVGVAVAAGLVRANKGAVLKTRWDWAMLLVLFSTNARDLTVFENLFGASRSIY
jgi:hypothetical protein